jgi:hypothetical protein
MIVDEMIAGQNKTRNYADNMIWTKYRRVGDHTFS